MPQTSVIFAYLIGGFLLYIVAKGELGQYVGIFFGPSTASSVTG